MARVRGFLSARARSAGGGARGAVHAWGHGAVLVRAGGRGGCASIHQARACSHLHKVASGATRIHGLRLSLKPTFCSDVYTAWKHGRDDEARRRVRAGGRRGRCLFGAESCASAVLRLRLDCALLVVSAGSRGRCNLRTPPHPSHPCILQGYVRGCSDTRGRERPILGRRGD